MIETFKKKIKKPLRQATSLFLIKDDKVLLAMKKRGFGQGRFNGVGGKREKDETIFAAARRETFEEIGVKPTKITKAAVLNFYFPHVALKENWNQQVVVFCVMSGKGSLLRPMR
jgi:8-oxo-dGTP pyrophosphatase MutT (NUDIX family)